LVSVQFGINTGGQGAKFTISRIRSWGVSYLLPTTFTS